MRGLTLTLTLCLLLSLFLYFPILSFALKETQKATPNTTLHFDAIYQFGDSLSDTGNLIRLGNAGSTSAFGRPPYGRTFFHRPTGRCSDGLLMVDYFAMFFGLPLLNPFLAHGSDFSHGANFAVAGATALDGFKLRTNNIIVPLGISSLDVQLGWFKSQLYSTCSNPQECRQKLRKALVLMGEIGGNDYNYAFSQGQTIEQASALVPQVVLTIKNAVKDVIEMGAMNVVVPGNLPIGCVPLYLVRFGRRDPTMYDDMECLKALNDFATYHNNLLQQGLQELRQQYPGVSIAYGDYYSAMKFVISHASALGFEKGGVQKPCCANGNNPYNFDLGQRCGSGVPVCPDPSKRVSWDGIHMTQQANKCMAKWLLEHFVPQLH